MKKIISIILALLMVAAALPALAAGEMSEAIVMVRTGFTTAAASDGITVSDTLDFPAPAGLAFAEQADFSIFKASSSKYTEAQLIDYFSAQSGVIAVSPNYRVTAQGLTDDAYADEQWSLENVGQLAGTPGTDIDVNSIWSKGTTGSPAVVAVVDTGVDYDHAELAANMWINPYPRELAGTYGYDFCDDDPDPMDENGHGTHCAGIIAAEANNGAGISGVNQSAQIMALKFLDSKGGGDVFSSLKCYEYICRAISLGVNVVAINNSWGHMCDSAIFKAVIDRAGELGAISVIAAGNYAQDLNADPLQLAPASVDSPYKITVAASTPTGELASFSNYGDSYVDIAAPGVSVLSSVSYDNLLPMLLDDEQRDLLAAGYADFSGYNSFGEMRILSAPGVSVTAAESTEQFFGSKGASLRIDYSGLNSDQPILIQLPYDAEEGEGVSQESLDIYKANAATEGQILYLYDSPYFETLEQFDDDNATEIKHAAMVNANHWATMTDTQRKTREEEQQRCLVLAITALDDGASGTLYIDNPTVSRLAEDSSAFGKYAFYNGTSMATPTVAGAIALVSAAKPELSPEQVRAAVLGSVAQTDSLEGKVADCGYLDLSKIDEPGPCISDAAPTSDGTVEIYGYNFGSSPTVTVNGETATPISAQDGIITLGGEGLNDRVCVFEVENERGKSKRAIRISRGEHGYDTLCDMTDIFKGGAAVSSGDGLYYIDSEGTVYSLSGGEPELTGRLEAKTLFARGSECAMSGRPVYLGGCIYAIFGASEGYMTYYRLARFNIAAKKWYDTAALPAEGGAENAIASTLAAYNGRLYLLGGLDAGTFEPLTAVMRFDGRTASWESVGDMPEGRFMSAAQQRGDKLYVMLGGAPEEANPAILIYDGSEWTTGPAIEGAAMNNTFGLYYGKDPDGDPIYQTINYLDAAVGLTRDGFIFAGLDVDGLGDTFNFDGEKLEPADARLFEGAETQLAIGAAAGGAVYAVSAVYDRSGALASAKLRSLAIDPGTLLLSAEVSGEGAVPGTGNYLPGDIARVKATPAKGWHLESLTANAKALSSPASIVMKGGVAVKAEFKRTVLSVNTPAGYIEAGGSRAFSASGAEKIIWRSTNTALATVSDEGLVSAKPGAGGRTVSIYAFAADGSGAKARCVLYIFNKTTSMKLTAPKSVLRVGEKLALNVQKTPASGTIARLAYSTSSAAAAVSAEGVVYARKPGSAVITARAIDGSGISARVSLTIIK